MSNKPVVREPRAKPSALGVRAGVDETLDSFLQRWSRHQGLSLANATVHWPDVDSPRRLQVHPTALFISHASIVTQVAPSRLRSMTTAHGWLAANWITRVELNNVLAYPGCRSWTPTDLSPLCPTCLAERPEWRLEWRMPWVFMCTRHNTMLVDTCQVCNGLLTVADRRLPHTNNPRTTQPVTAYSHFNCLEPHLLTGSPASDDAASAQRKLIDLAYDPSKKESKSRKTWAADVRSVAALALSLATHQQPEALGQPLEVQRLLHNESTSHNTTQRRWVKKAPVNSELRALALRAALTEIDGVHEQSTDTPVLRALMNLDLSGAALSSWIDDHSVRTPAVQHIKKLATRQRQRTSHQLDGVHQQTLNVFDFETKSVPQLFWECSSPAGYLEWVGRPGRRMRLAFLSLCVTRAATGSWTRAAEELNFPPDRGPQWARYVLGQLSRKDRAEIAPWTTAIIGQLSKAPPFQRVRVRSHADLRKVAFSGCANEIPVNVWCPCIA